MVHNIGCYKYELLSRIHSKHYDHFTCQHYVDIVSAFACWWLTWYSEHCCYMQLWGDASFTEFTKIVTKNPKLKFNKIPLISHQGFGGMKVLNVGLEHCCTPSVVFQAKWFMLSSIHCVMRPIHSDFCLLIVKMCAAVLEGCLIDVSLVKAVAPGFVCTVLDLEPLFLFAFKRSHKLFMCCPKWDYFS